MRRARRLAACPASPCTAPPASHDSHISAPSSSSSSYAGHSANVLRIAPDLFGAIATPRGRTSAALQQRRYNSTAAEHSSVLHSVDINNFETAKELLTATLNEATFVCIDCEFTGLKREKQQGRSTLRSADERYQEIRKTLRGKLIRGEEENSRVRKQGFLIMQVGLACFCWDATAGKYRVVAFSFYLTPKPVTGKDSTNVKVEHDLHFGCLSSALTFLSSHGFDFNKWLHTGVPFMSRTAYESERERVATKSLFSAQDHSNSYDTLQARKGFLCVWEALLQSGRPLVGHQCLLDILYLWQQMEAPLPKSLSQFLRDLSMQVSLMVDTKHLLTAYPDDLLTAVKIKLKRLQIEKLTNDGEALVVQEKQCNELVRVLGGRNALKAMQLVDLYTLLEPLVADRIPPMQGENAAHDAGYDAYMTGVVYAAVHSIIHTHGGTAAPTAPSSDLVLKMHTSDAPSPLGSPSSFSYANKLHVFASPFAINTFASVPPVDVTHTTTVVVIPPPGGSIDVNRISQVLANSNPHADLYWIEFQRTAVVVLYSRNGDDKTVIEEFTNAASPFRWEVLRATEFIRKTLMSPTKRPEGTSRKAHRKKERSHRSNWLKWVRRRLAESAQQSGDAKEATRLLSQTREQSAQRLAELIGAQKEVKKLRAIETSLIQQQQKLATTTETLSALEVREAGWERSKVSLESSYDALQKEKISLQKGMDSYRQQSDALRGQVTDAFKKIERLERLVSDERLKAETLNATLATTRAEASRLLTDKNKAVQEKDKMLQQQIEEKRQKVMKRNVAPPVSPAVGTPPAADSDASEGAVPKPTSAPAPPAPPAPPTPSESTTPAPPTMSPPKKPDHIGRPGLPKGSKVEELRSGHWAISNCKNNAQILLAVEPGRHQVLELKDCKSVRIFVEGSVSSLTFTGCSDVHLYCELFVSDAGKPWSWGDNSRVSGNKIFYFSSDKSSIKINQLSVDKWPSQHLQATVYTAKKLKQYLQQVEVRRSKNIQEMTRFVMLLVVMTIVMQYFIPAPDGSDKGGKAAGEERGEGAGATGNDSSQPYAALPPPPPQPMRPTVIQQ